MFPFVRMSVLEEENMTGLSFTKSSTPRRASITK